MAGTDGMIKSDASPLLLSRPDEHSGGGGGGDAVAATPVSVSTSVDVYSGGGVRSSSLSGAAAVDVPTAVFLRDQEARTEPPLDDDAGGSGGSGRRRSRETHHVGFNTGSRNRNAAEGSPYSRATTQTQGTTGSSARLSSDVGGARGHGDVVPRGDIGREPLPSTTSNGDCSTTTCSATGTITALATVAEETLEKTAAEENGSGTATRACVGGTPYPNAVGDAVSSMRGKSEATESSEAPPAAGDWYQYSKLTAAGKGLTRTAVAAGGGGGAHGRTPAAGAAIPRVPRPR